MPCARLPKDRRPTWPMNTGVFAWPNAKFSGAGAKRRVPTAKLLAEACSTLVDTGLIGLRAFIHGRGLVT